MTDTDTDSRVSSTFRDGILLVRFTAPERRNAVDLAFTAALAAALDGGLDSAGAVAIVADGDQFCVGGDVRAMAASPDKGAFVAELADSLHRSMLRLADGPPVVIGVRGWAAGAGMSLVCASDVVVVGRSAMLQPAYPGIGLSPDGGMSWNLPRIVGDRQARSLILRNAVLDASAALRLGLADEAADDADVEQVVLERAAALASGPRDALRAVKRLIAQSDTRTYAEHLDSESVSIARCAASADGAEGLTSFLERRRPTFAGPPNTRAAR